MSENVDDQNLDDKGGAGSGAGGASDDNKSLLDKIAALEKQNSEFFNEIKSVKSKNKKFEDEKEAAEQQRLKEEGKFKELLEKSESKNLTLAKELKNNVMDRQLRDAALKAGCPVENIETFMTLAGSYEENVTFDEKFQADSKSLNAFVESMKEKHKNISLFGSSTKPPNDGGKGGNEKTKIGMRAALANVY